MTETVTVPCLDVHALAQEIRRVDGRHDLGAGALAEALIPFLRGAFRVSDEAQGDHSVMRSFMAEFGMTPSMMASKAASLEGRARATDAVLAATRADLARERERVDRLTDENEALRQEPWPEWATKVLAAIRKRSGYDGYDDQDNGVDLAAELEEAFSELEREAESARADRDALAAALADARERAAEDDALTELQYAVTALDEALVSIDAGDDLTTFNRIQAAYKRAKHHSDRLRSRQEPTR